MLAYGWRCIWTDHAWLAGMVGEHAVAWLVAKMGWEKVARGGSAPRQAGQVKHGPLSTASEGTPESDLLAQRCHAAALSRNICALCPSRTYVPCVHEHTCTNARTHARGAMRLLAGMGRVAYTHSLRVLGVAAAECAWLLRSTSVQR